MDMKGDSMSDPYEIAMAFYKKFWGTLKGTIHYIFILTPKFYGLNLLRSIGQLLI
jgi:hypothetical protein